MIARLLRVVGDDSALRRCIVWWTVSAVLQGVGFVLLVPVLSALLDGDVGGAARWAGAMAAVLVVYAVVRYLAQLASYQAAIGLSRGLFQRLGDQIARLPLGWFDTDRVGHVGRLTSKGVIDVMGIPAHLLRPMITAFVTPATVLVAMVLLDWRLALAAAVSIPFAWWTYRWTGRLVRSADARLHHAAADAGSRLVEFAQTQAVLRSHGRTVDGNQVLDDALAEQRDAGRRLLTVAVPGLAGFVSVLQLAFTAILFVGVAIAAGGGDVDGAELVAVLVLVVRFIEPLVAAADIGGALKLADATLDRADALLDTPLLPEPDADTATESPAHDSPAHSALHVELHDVSFGYVADRRVIDDVSLSVPAGTMTALVGPSGSGKTTIARLVARFWDVDAGSVTIGGADVRSFTTEALMSQVSIVFQETYLFAGTIAENLRLAKPDATDDELHEVATRARLDEVIERLPGRWDADVGEGGSRLSGGERQRVSIARAMLKDAPIVLLDEATAAIDPLNEVA
ncbi:MAG: ABC transporter ATP-binding protein, partial [Actinomycetota bacterium]